MKKTNSIKKQLTVKYVSIVTLATVFFVVMGILIGKQMIMRNSEDILSNFSIQVGKDLDNIINLEKSKVDIISNMPIIKDKNTPLDIKLQELSKIVEQQKYKKGAIISLDGTCNTTLGETVDVRDKEYFEHNLKGETYLTPPNVSKADGGLQISITAPIYDDNSEMIGILFISKDAEKFSDITNEISFGKSGTAYVVDQNGTNIINRDIQKVIDKVNRIEDAKTKPEFKELAQITEKMIRGESGTGNYDFDGKTKFLGYAPIESTGWSVGITAETSDMLSGLYTMVYSFVGIGIVIILLVTIVTMIISRGFSNRLNLVKEEVDDISKGKFIKKEISEKINDEITQIFVAIEDTKESVSDMITSIKDSSKNVKSECEELVNVSNKFLSGTQNINAAIEDSAKATENQANELADINDILENFSENITENSKNVLKVNDKSIMISDQANASQKDMDDLLSSISRLNDSFKSFSSEVDEMHESMKTINDITKLINSISDQTNLLALNAAIEAARAGEAGKGFAVVADEIRNLAEQSRSSTENAYEVIENVLKKVANIISASEKIADELASGKENVDNSVKSFENILDSVSEISPMINVVNSNFKEILNQKNEIMEKVESVSAVSEELSASSQEILASTNEFVVSTETLKNSSETLNELTQDMNDSVDVFEIK